ncbi:MAG TPA: flagellar hook-basal body complex protein, partial [Alphaproteobacteria bacterium]|nr:flagellar hook-basal body complex protein [Alphaproteobacteria bacterium]
FGTSRDLQQGEMRSTLNPLDMAISGDGYFTVQTPQGLRYTRNGHFKIDGQGYLVTASGLQVLDNTNQPIQLNPSDTKFDVGQDGTITGSQGPIGRLAMVSFQNEQNLVPVGNGLYRTDDPVQPAAKASVVQGMIESSNVEPIMEMTRMIEASRAYQSTQAVLSRDDDIRRQAINRLGRVSS